LLESRDNSMFLIKKLNKQKSRQNRSKGKRKELKDNVS